LSRELYFYWRIAGDAGAALGAVRRFQQAVTARWPAASARLLLRADGSTVMEVYAAAGAERAALVAEGDAATAPWRAGPRHLEVFDPV
jgi:hypothetical protein